MTLHPGKRCIMALRSEGTKTPPCYGGNLVLFVLASRSTGRPRANRGWIQASWREIHRIVAGVFYLALRANFGETFGVSLNKRPRGGPSAGTV
jgi:hypothetical protein